MRTKKEQGASPSAVDTARERWGSAEVAEPDIELELWELCQDELRKQDAEEGLYPPKPAPDR